MGFRYDEFAPGEFYHVYSRGIEKRKIFLDGADHKRFMSLLVHCLPVGQIQSYSLTCRAKKEVGLTRIGSGLVDLLCFCLMENHFHLLLKENVEGGVSLYMQRVLTSYARYFNVRRERSGSLFINPFKAVLVNGDEQLLHVSRYIHLNPYVAYMVEDPFAYKWHSLGEYMRSGSNKVCHTRFIRQLMNCDEYKDFILDEADYARSLEDGRGLMLDIDD